MKKVLSVAAIAVMISLTGCDSKEEKTEAAVAPQIQDDRQGKVVEFDHVPGYTYALVDTSKGQQWFAGPSAELEPGQTVFWSQGAVMNSFTSKALGRSFDSITFIDAYLSQPASAVPVQAAAPAGSKGEVISVQASAGYLYLEVNTGAENIWVAAPMADVKAGDQIEWSGASLMTNFSSKSLGRTFAEIHFAGAVAKVN